MLLPIHVAAGGLAIVLGAVALLVKKGGTIHRRSGPLFVYVMLVLGTSAAILGNVLGGLMTVYFVVTALTTVRPASPWTRRINAAALAVAIGLAFVDIAGGVKGSFPVSGGYGPYEYLNWAAKFFVDANLLEASVKELNR